MGSRRPRLPQRPGKKLQALRRARTINALRFFDDCARRGGTS